ncbi:MAG TPA: hypothetical protein VHO48_02610 [Anaerolineaceae bacterium]|nr:hypothetical protein [Anaerolineaceae bacterium]
MEGTSFSIFDGKVVIRMRDPICDHPDELVSSRLFLEILKRGVDDLARRKSPLLNIFAEPDPGAAELRLLAETLKYLTKLPAEQVVKLEPDAAQFFRDPLLFNDFTEYLYNYWRHLQRLIVCDMPEEGSDRRPYRTFNRTVEALTHLVRSTYRDIQENITGNHPRIYRQVPAGAAIGAIAAPIELAHPGGVYAEMDGISVIRQVLIYPPLIFTPPMNKRTGQFVRIDENPLEWVEANPDDWLCYPAKVGERVILVYFSMKFFELGFAMCNLFELADENDLKRKPDAIFLYGLPEESFRYQGESQTVFFDDEANGMLVGAVPDADRYGYFGYLKKMVLTLHNISMMKEGRMPFHGALVNLLVRDRGHFTVLIMGDTGAGKSETLEALRAIGGLDIQSITIIADDMGSLRIGEDGRVLGYGTETGAFVRLDDLQPGYAFGQIDRTIIMSPNQTNARVVLPVTTFANVVKGFPIDIVLYANNYDPVDDEHAILEWFASPEQALAVFREGRVMSKGTTTTTGMVATYFANIFGPPQYRDLHEAIAQEYFAAFYRSGACVGQFRTRLGVPGMEQSGPEAAARALLELLKSGKQGC